MKTEDNLKVQLQELAELRADLADTIQTKEVEVSLVLNRYADQIDELEDRIERTEACVASLMKRLKADSFSSEHGSVKFLKPTVTVSVDAEDEDLEELLEYVERVHPDAIKTSQSLVKNSIKKILQEGGQFANILNQKGVHLEVGEPRMKIELP